MHPVQTRLLPIVYEHQDFIKKEKEEAKAKSWLKGGHPLGPLDMEMTDDLFFNLTYCDHASFSSVSDIQQIFEFFAQFLEKIAANNPTDKIKRIQRLVSSAIKMSQTYQWILQRKDHRNTFEGLIENELDDLASLLKSEGELWIPLVWRSNNSVSHAILLHVKALGEVTFFFSEFDRGEEQRAFLINKGSGERLKSSLQATITGCQVERLQDRKFFEILLQFMFIEKSANQSFLIKPLKAYLKGNLIWDSNLRKAIGSTTPATKALFGAIYSKVEDKNLYNSWKFLLQSWALCHYKGPYNQVAGEVVENLLRRQSCPPEFKQTADAIFLKITKQDKISKSPLSMPSQILDNTIYFPLKELEATDETFVSHYSIDWEELYSLQQSIHELEKWPGTVDWNQVILYFEKVSKWIAATNTEDKGMKLLVIKELLNLALALPCPNHDKNSFWKGVPSTLSSKMMQLQFSIMKQMKKFRVNCEDLQYSAILYKFYAIISQIAEPIIPENATLDLDGFKDTFLCHRKIIADANLQREIQRLKDYFFPGNNHHENVSYTSKTESVLFHVSALFDAEAAPFLSTFGEWVKTLLVLELSRIRNDPILWNRFLERSQYKINVHQSWILKSLKESDSMHLQLTCLLAEPIQGALLPLEIHFLLQASFLIQIEHRYAKYTVDDGEFFNFITSIGHKDPYMELKGKWNSVIKSKDRSYSDLIRFEGVNVIVEDQKQALSESVEVSREIFLLGEDPYQEVARSFDLINRRGYLLKHEEIQKILLWRIFRHGNLLVLAKDDFKIIPDCSKILKKQIKQFIVLNQMDIALYLCKLGLNLKKVVHGFDPDIEIFDFRSMVIKKIAPFYKGQAHELADVFKMLSEFSLHPSDAFLACYYAKISNQDIQPKQLQKYYEQIGFLTEENDSVFNEILSHLEPDALKQKWKGVFPKFRSGDYELDFNAIELIDQKKLASLTLLPRHVLKDEVFKRIFRGKIVSCVESGGKYFVEDAGKNVLIVDPSKLHYFKEREGKRLQFVQTPKFLHWNLIQSALVQTWYETIDENKGVLHVEFLGQTSLMKVPVKMQGRGFYKPKRIEMEGMPLILHPALGECESLYRFVRFKWENIYFLTDASGEFQKLDIPAYGLQFTQEVVKGKSRICSKQWPGFFLIKDTSVPKTMKHWIALGNDKGDCKILYHEGSLHAFDLVEGNLSANNVMGELTLFLIFLQNDEYSRAFDLLKGFHPLQLIGQEADQKGKLEQILGFFTSKKRDPITNALFIHFFLKFEQNFIKFAASKDHLEGWDRDLVTRIQHRYIDIYCQNRNNIPKFLLSKRQERMLLECFDAYNLSENLRYKNRQLITEELIVPLNEKEIISSLLSYSYENKLFKDFNHFKHYFKELYEMARKESSYLSTMIELNANHSGCPYYQAIKTVLAHPKKFPYLDKTTVSEMLGLLGKVRVESRVPVLLPPIKMDYFKTELKRRVDPVVSHESFKALDDHFDAFFLHLFDLYCTTTQCLTLPHKENLPEIHPNKNVEKRLKAENHDLEFYLDQMPAFETYYSFKDDPYPVLKALKEKRRSLRFLKTAKKALFWKGQNPHALGEYLIFSTRLQQINQIISLLENPLSSPHHTIAALLKRRSYEPSTSTLDRLAFEESKGFFYYPDQLNKIEILASSKESEILAQMPTGYGKTKVMIPLLDNLKANEGRLVINVWPRSIELINTLDLEQTYRGWKNKFVDRLIFNRSTPVCQRLINYLYQDFVYAYNQSIPISCSLESLMSMQLHMLSFLNDPNGKEKEIELFLKIFQLISKKGWASIDEAHLELDPLSKLIYTLGEATLLPAEEYCFLEDVVQFLIEKDLAGIRQNLQSKFSSYEEKLLPELIEWLENYFKMDLKHFLLEQDPDKDFANNPKRDLLALAKGVVALLLKSALQGSVDEHYGLSKLHFGKIEYAIPYVMVNTPKENPDNPTQFKNWHETLLKTFFVYLHKGLSVSQVVKMVDSLKMDALQEGRWGTPLQKTKSFKFFKEHVDHPGFNLLTITSDDIKENFSLFSHHQKLIFYYIKSFVATNIKLYKETLEANPQNFKSLFASKLSLTATPQDRENHGLNTFFVPMRGTSGQVTHLFLTKCKTLHSLTSLSPQGYLQEANTICSQNPLIHATLDIGACFKGVSNRDVALKMLKGNELCSAVLYFDEEEKVYKRVDKESNSQVYTYYDQSRCFGTDIKQAINACALMMVNHATTKSAAGQAAGRMREWHLSQNVEVAYSGSKETIESLLMQWIENDTRQREESNFQSLVQQIENVTRSQVLEEIVNSPVSRAIGIFNQHRSLFINTSKSSPWDLYAYLPKPVEPVSYLKDLSLALTGKEIPIEDVALPEKVQAYSVGLGQECHVLIDIEMEVEVNTEALAEVKEPKRVHRKNDWNSFDLFEKGFEKPHSVAFSKPLFEASLFAIPKIVRSIGLNPFKDGALNVLLATAGVFALGAAAAATAYKTRAEGLKMISLTASTFCAMTILQVVQKMTRIAKMQAEFFHFETYLQNYLEPANRPFCTLFEGNIVASKNFFHEFNFDGRMDYSPQTPLTAYQKPIFSLLVLRDEVEGFTFCMIDPNESQIFYHKLQEDYKNTLFDESAKRTRKVGIYDLYHNQFLVTGKNGFDLSDYDHPQFWKMLGQVKFFNGQLHYLPKEELYFGDHLKRCMEKLGADKVRRFFVDHILKNRPTARMQMIRKGESPIWIKNTLEA